MIWTPDPTLALDTFGNHPNPGIAGRWSQEWEVLRLTVSRLPRGLMGQATISADQGSITTLVDLTNLTVTFNAEQDRRYLLQGGVHLSSTVANDEGGLRVTTGAGGVINRARVQINTSGRRYFVQVEGTHVPGAGSATYKLRAERIQGTGTLSANAGANEEGWLRVYDVGPST